MGSKPCRGKSAIEAKANPRAPSGACARPSNTAGRARPKPGLNDPPGAKPAPQRSNQRAMKLSRSSRFRHGTGCLCGGLDRPTGMRRHPAARVGPEASRAPPRCRRTGCRARRAMRLASVAAGCSAPGVAGLVDGPPTRSRSGSAARPWNTAALHRALRKTGGQRAVSAPIAAGAGFEKGVPPSRRAMARPSAVARGGSFDRSPAGPSSQPWRPPVRGVRRRGNFKKILRIFLQVLVASRKVVSTALSNAFLSV